MMVSSGAPPVKSPVLRSITLGMKQMNSGAPGKAAWTTQTALSASAMPTTREPAIVIGVVEPPMGMVTKPIGTPAAAKTRPASSVPASLPSGVTVPISYTHLRAHETRHELVCRLLLEKKKKTNQNKTLYISNK